MAKMLLSTPYRESTVLQHNTYVCGDIDKNAQTLWQNEGGGEGGLFKLCVYGVLSL